MKKIFVILIFINLIASCGSAREIEANIQLTSKADIRIEGTWFRRGGDIQCGGGRPARRPILYADVRAVQYGNTLGSNQSAMISVLDSTRQYTSRITEVKLNSSYKNGGLLASLQMTDFISPGKPHSLWQECSHAESVFSTERVFLDGSVVLDYKVPKGVNAVRVTVTKNTALLVIQNISTIEGVLNTSIDLSQPIILWTDKKSSDQGDRHIKITYKFTDLPDTGPYANITPDGLFQDNKKISDLDLTFEPLGYGLLAKQGSVALINKLVDYYSKSSNSGGQKKTSDEIINALGALLDFENYLDSYITFEDLSAIKSAVDTLGNKALSSVCFGLTCQFEKAAVSLISTRLALKFLDQFLPFCQRQVIQLPLLGRTYTVSRRNLISFFLVRLRTRVESLNVKELYTIWKRIEELSKAGFTYRQILDQKIVRDELEQSLRAFDSKQSLEGYAFHQMRTEVDSLIREYNFTQDMGVLFQNLNHFIDQGAATESLLRQELVKLKSKLIVHPTDDVIDGSALKLVERLAGIQEQIKVEFDHVISAPMLARLDPTFFNSVFSDFSNGPLIFYLDEESIKSDPTMYFIPIQKLYLDIPHINQTNNRMLLCL